eukprot:11162596-Lingulodinium_polyedra.AAC.1
MRHTSKRHRLWLARCGPARPGGLAFSAVQSPAISVVELAAFVQTTAGPLAGIIDEGRSTFFFADLEPTVEE